MYECFSHNHYQRVFTTGILSVLRFLLAMFEVAEVNLFDEFLKSFAHSFSYSLSVFVRKNKKAE